MPGIRLRPPRAFMALAILTSVTIASYALYRHIDIAEPQPPKNKGSAKVFQSNRKIILDTASTSITKVVVAAIVRYRSTTSSRLLPWYGLGTDAVRDIQKQDEIEGSTVERYPIYVAAFLDSAFYRYLEVPRAIIVPPNLSHKVVLTVNAPIELPGVDVFSLLVDNFNVTERNAQAHQLLLSWLETQQQQQHHHRHHHQTSGYLCQIHSPQNGTTADKFSEGGVRIIEYSPDSSNHVPSNSSSVLTLARDYSRITIASDTSEDSDRPKYSISHDLKRSSNSCLVEHPSAHNELHLGDGLNLAFQADNSGTTNRSHKRTCSGEAGSLNFRPVKRRADQGQIDILGCGLQAIANGSPSSQSYQPTFAIRKETKFLQPLATNPHKFLKGMTVGTEEASGRSINTSRLFKSSVKPENFATAGPVLGLPRSHRDTGKLFVDGYLNGESYRTVFSDIQACASGQEPKPTCYWNTMTGRTWNPLYERELHAYATSGVSGPMTPPKKYLTMYESYHLNWCFPTPDADAQDKIFMRPNVGRRVSSNFQRAQMDIKGTITSRNGTLPFNTFPHIENDPDSDIFQNPTKIPDWLTMPADSFLKPLPPTNHWWTEVRKERQESLGGLSGSPDGKQRRW